MVWQPFLAMGQNDPPQVRGGRVQGPTCSWCWSLQQPGDLGRATAAEASHLRARFNGSAGQIHPLGRRLLTPGLKYFKLCLRFRELEMQRAKLSVSQPVVDSFKRFFFWKVKDLTETMFTTQTKPI